jgi:PAS domain S-box-containing protein
VGSDLEEVQLFVRGPVVVFKWRNAEGWPVEYVSLNAVDTFGYTPREFLDGDVSYAEIIHSDDLQRVAAEVRGAVAGDEESFEHEPYRVIHHDGSVRWLYDVTHLVRRDGEVTHFVGYVIDITKRIEAEQEARDLEHRLLSAQRLESLGMLAGGVAHDFNNILTGILGEANLTRRALARDETADVLPSVDRVERLALRAADLTRELLAYSGKGRFVVLPMDLSAVVDDLASMLGVVISKKATLELDLGTDLPAVEADRAQLQQIVMNLIQNASDALGDAAGTITVRTRLETHTNESLAGAFNADNVPPGDFVKLEVSDTGCGMSDAVLAHVFEPFFTTKATGRGLGMSAIQGIVRSHAGAITVSSTPGSGTTFELFFPTCDQPAVVVRESEPTGGWRGLGTALVVDDEPSVLRVATRMLEQLGYDTLTATDGKLALEVVEARADEISVVLLDMMMPIKGGAETMKTLRERWPALPVVISSGFDETDVTSRLSGLPATTFLQKPYRLPDLEAALRAVGAPSETDPVSAAG